MDWLSLVLISTVSFSLTSILQRALLREEQSSPVAYAFVFQLFVSSLFVVYVLIYGFNIPPLLPVLPHLILMSLLYALGNLSLFKSLKLSEASEVAVISSTKSIWTVLTAALFLGEVITMSRLFGTFLVVFGVIVVTWKKKVWNINKGYLYAILAAVFYGIAFTNDAYLVNYFDDVPSYMVLAFIFPSLMVLIFQPSLVKDLGSYKNKKSLVSLLAASIFYAISAVTIFLAYQTGGEASQIAPISQSSIVLTVVFAYILLKERSNLIKKFIGSLIVFLGVLILRT